MRTAWLICVSALLMAGLACSGEKPTTIYREGEPPVSQVKDDDPEMNAAIQKARDTLDDFLKELTTPGKRDFLIKVAMDNSEGSLEHIWADSVQYRDGKFTANLANEPVRLPGKKVGDSATVDRSEISDWLIMDGDNMTGGYTAKLLMEREGMKQ